jgi:two-component system, OmpR family, sensor histidine kinase SenX3
VDSGQVGLALLAALVIGVVVGVLVARARRSPEPVRTPEDRPHKGGQTIEPDEELLAGKHGMKGLGRRSLDSLRVGVVVLDAEDHPVLVNPAARAMGLLRSGGAPGTIAAHPILRTLAGQVRRTGVRREVELDLPRGRAGGAQAPLGLHLRAVALNTTHVAVEAADVTESHRLARVRRDFVANVSHELKTPIGALQLLAEALLDATELTAADEDEEQNEDLLAARRFAERIHHESARMGRLVSELLELTRLQGAEPLPTPEPVAIDWVIAEVVDRTRTTASAKGIEVVYAGPKGATVYGSDSQVATAVTNLVENAIAYSGRPGHRHRGARHRPHLRTVLPGRPGPVPVDRRDRTRSRDRQAHRHQPRRAGRRDQHARRRLDIHPAPTSASPGSPFAVTDGN